jgi:transaldolase
MSNSDYFHRVSAQTATRFWINNVTKQEVQWAIQAGAVGCTQNPSYTWKMLTSEDEKNHVTRLIKEMIAREKDNNEVIVRLQRDLVGDIAKYFMPLYEVSGGKQGFVSIQGDPFHEDTATIIKYARFNREAGPNIMAKIPATVDGLKAIEVLAKERIPINATEVMAVRQAMDVCEVYVHATKGMKDPAPIFISHITGIYDEYLHNHVRDSNIKVSSDALGQSAMAIAKKTYWMMKEKRYPVGFIGGGARTLGHFTEMVGAEAEITINWKGTADKLLELDLPVVQRFFEPVPFSVVDELVEKVDEFRRGYFLNAITPPEYEDFGPVKHFRTMFEGSWKNAVNFAVELREKGSR